MSSVIDTYNDSSNRGLKNRTPNEVYDNHDNQLARHLSDMVHNHNVYKSVPFKSDDKVRILEDKGKFDKGKNTFSKDVYTVNKKQGYKILVDGTSRKLKPSELLKVNSVSNPRITHMPCQKFQWVISPLSPSMLTSARLI